MSFGLFFSLLTTHFICDFILQFKKILLQRQSKSVRNRIKGNISHSFIHFAVSLAVTGWLYSFSIKYILLLLLIAVLHGTVDFIKGYLFSVKPLLKNNISLFLSDQLLHLVILFIFSCLISLYVTYKPLGIVEYQNTVKFITVGLEGITYPQKVILTIGIMIAALWGVGIFVRMFLAGLKKKTVNEKNVESHIKSIVSNQSTPDGGFIIGIMERFFIICSIVLDMTQIIGFLLATKSIARFKKFDDDTFVENFIIGSFISFSSAIVAGVIIKALNII